MMHVSRGEQRVIDVPIGSVILEGNLSIPEHARGIVLFAHGSGSSRHSPRNRFVARQLFHAGLATLLLDLLTSEEDAIDVRSGQLRFDIDMLAERLAGATDWLNLGTTSDLPVGFFGASTGAAAALVAAAARSDRVAAVVSRGGRPDLAGSALHQVQAPTLLIVGGADGPVIPLNWGALEQIGSTNKKLEIVPGATHLFEEPGALEEVARLATEWFSRWLHG